MRRRRRENRVTARLVPLQAAVLAVALIAAAPAGAQTATPAADQTEPALPEAIVLPGADAAPYYEDALARYNRGDYTNAVVQLKNALRADPDNLPARILIGQAHLHNGDAAEAEQAFTRALQAGADEVLILPALAEAYLRQRKFKQLLETIRPGGRPAKAEAQIMLIRGLAHLEQRDNDDAEKALALARRLDPENPGAVLGLARLALGSGNFADAETLVDEAVALDTENPNAWFVKGDIHRVRGAPGDAVTDYDRAIELAPGQIEARLARASTLIDLGEHDRAKADVDFVRQEIPLDPRAAYLQALLFTRQGDPAAAQSVLREAALIMGSLDPDAVLNDPPNLLLSGILHYAQGNYQDARPYLDRYVKLVAHHAGARRMLGDILLRADDPAEAVRILEPALPLAPNDPQLLLLIGRAYMDGGRFEDATAALAEATQLEPNNIELLAQLATARLAGGQRRQAVKDLEAARAIDPTSVRTGSMLAAIHLEDHNYTEALAVATALAAQNPGDPELRNLTGTAHAGLGQVEQGRGELEHAIALDPDYLPSYFNLAGLLIANGDVTGARALYDTVLQRNRNNSRAMSELSAIAQAAGDLATAATWLEKLRAADPRNLEAQLRLFEVYMLADRPTAALYLAREMETNNPASAAVMIAKGRAQLAVHERIDAGKSFRTAAALSSRSPDRLTVIADLQIVARDVASARSTLVRALRTDPGHLAARASLAMLEAQAGNIDKALEMAATIRASHPSSPLGEVVAGDVLIGAGRIHEAVAAYENGLRMEPSSALVVRLYGARRAAGQARRGLRELERWIERHPDDAVVQNALASAYIGVGDYETALEQHEQLAAERPDDAAILTNLAWLYQRAGDPRAVELAERAYGLAPNSAGTIDTLGWVLVNNAEVQRGLTLLREAHARASNDAGVRYHLAVALQALGRLDDAREQLAAAFADGAPFAEEDEARALLSELAAGAGTAPD